MEKTYFSNRVYKDTLEISGFTLTAERLRMNLITQNLANAETTHTPQGGPYHRCVPVFTVAENGGVTVNAVVEDPAPFKLKYDPSHQDAGPDGYVQMPNVDVAAEIIDLMAAARAYEASVAALVTARGMALKSLEISSR